LASFATPLADMELLNISDYRINSNKCKEKAEGQHTGYLIEIIDRFIAGLIF